MTDKEFQSCLDPPFSRIKRAARLPATVGVSISGGFF
jgi:hypothetical protein